MFTEKDNEDIKARGSNPLTVKQQIDNFISGFPFLQIIKPATVGDGIIQLNEADTLAHIRQFDEKTAGGASLLKFVPASGAASRMFKALYEAKDALEAGASEKDVKSKKDIQYFFDNLTKFAFYPDLAQVAGKSPNELSALEVLKLVLTEDGLNYGNLPKGLLKFHSYKESNRTSFEEHCVEGALYAQKSNNSIDIHFTVSPEHQEKFEEHLADIKSKYEQQFGAKYTIAFSQQKPKTDTIAVTPENEPFRKDDGSLLFRPGGHGALIANLGELDADIIFIKNIDNVVPDYLKPETVKYKKALAGLLFSLQEKIFSYQQVFDTHHYSALQSVFLAEAASFLENVLNVKPPTNQYYTEKEELYHYLKNKFNRPIRICGMVRNEGEPGGGPFWAKNSDDSVSLQVVESSQIDFSDQKQKALVESATHFNPVDLVCACKNYKGEKFDLAAFVDPATGFISKKSLNGKDLKAQELPGLWNGAMADWNTLFVEVPIQTFNPVKTVNDLLRKEHQPEE
ncbi:DUF4301 family protein [Mangrovibacterium marinum]|uniref:Uncharacterized protein DUF4301 n=1 Tax=Mangrovibacterium marinum TaxID=1639118 RepID=A0A2T5BZ56_9BACT|nr:DUF4301 family protein [Mangrovibacterium marinum]PTN07542.1 uncharacterized protein DUF4301 [Mangrovibacterium marinum]